MKKIGFIHSTILYLIVIDKVANDMESRLGSDNINILHMIVLAFVYLTICLILISYSFISRWLYKIFLRFIYNHRVRRPIDIIAPGDSDDPTFDRLEWVHSELRRAPFLILTLSSSSSSEEHITLAFLHESDLLAYKLMWPEDV